MDDAIQLVSKLKGFSGKGDTSQQAFGLLDEVSSTFREKLSAAQEKEKSEANSAQSGKQQRQEKSSSPERVSQEEASEETLSEEPLTEEVILEAPLQPDTSLMEWGKEESALEGAEEQEELPESSEIETLTEEVAPKNEQPSLTSEAPLQSSEESVEAPLSEISDEGNLAPLEKEVSQPLEKQVEEERVQESALPSEREQEDAPTLTEEPTQGTNKKEASAPTQENFRSPQLKEREAPISEEKGSLSTDQKKPLVDAVSDFESRGPDFEQEKTPLASPSHGGEKSQALEEALIQGGESAEELSPEDFHSITAEKDSGLIELSSEETQEILKGLEQLSQNTHIESPNGERLSEKMLQGLRASNPLMAQEIEGTKGNTPTPQVTLERSSSPTAPAANRGQASSASKFDNPKMERLKSRIVSQVRFQLKMAAKGKGGEIRMQLQPQYLGKVKVKLELESDMAKATFLVENQSVKEMLQKSVSSLEKAFQEQGIEVSSVEVHVTDQNNQEFGQGKAFSSAEDQEAARAWLASFRRFDEEQEDEPLLVGSEESEDDGINVVV